MECKRSIELEQDASLVLTSFHDFCAVSYVGLRWRVRCKWNFYAKVSTRLSNRLSFFVPICIFHLEIFFLWNYQMKNISSSEVCSHFWRWYHRFQYFGKDFSSFHCPRTLTFLIQLPKLKSLIHLFLNPGGRRENVSIDDAFERKFPEEVCNMMYLLQVESRFLVWRSEG